MDNHDLIDQYFSNSLSPKEQLLFNELLQNDKNFKDEFLFQKDLKKSIVKRKNADLKNTLKNFEKKIASKNKTLYKRWMVAASITLIIGIGSVFIKTTYFPSSEKLFAQNFKPYRNIIHPIVRGKSLATIESSAFSAYENENYNKALNLFNSIPIKNSTYIPFYKAMCYLSIDNFDQAIMLLLPITESTYKKDISGKNFDVLANWYIALAYLKKGDKEKAISKFHIVAKNKRCNYKREQAEKILIYLE